MEAWWSASGARWVTWIQLSTLTTPVSLQHTAATRQLLIVIQQPAKETIVSKVETKVDLLGKIGTVFTWATRAVSNYSPPRKTLLPLPLLSFLFSWSVDSPGDSKLRVFGGHRVIIEPRPDTKDPFNVVQRSSLRGPGHRLLLAWPQYMPLADAARLGMHFNEIHVALSPAKRAKFV